MGGLQRLDRGLLLVIGLALAKLAFHAATNGQYGFHRDELATLDDARHLAWGYVAYPPLTPFLGRLELALFGTSLSGFRFLAAAAQASIAVLAALMARRFGGGLAAMLVAAGATAFSPVSLGASALFQYVSFDALWCVLVCLLFAALLDTGDPRLWLAIGAALGLGALTKYTVGVYVVGLGAAILASPARRHLATRWPWLGALASFALFAPNLVWQARHGFVSLEFLKHIHARDVAIGRTASFFLDQVKESTNPLTVPLWVWGLLALLVAPHLRRFRPLALFSLVSFLVFALAKGRGYYTAPLYPVLFAAGASELERVLAAWTLGWRRAAYAVLGALLVLAGASTALFALPLAPVGSKLFRLALAENGDFPEEIGWPELAQEVARIYRSLPEEERAHAGIYCGNYGEAGAVDLYGPALSLPQAISGIDSYWERGPGTPPPTTVIVLGATRDRLEKRFGKVELAGHTPNPLNVENEETTKRPDIFLCREPLEPIEKLWPQLRSFG